MFLYIVRHAWAGHSGDPAWPDDAQRPLTDEGRKRFAKVARRLAQAGCSPALIASSPLVRCRQTAAVLAERLPGGPPIVELDALRPGSDLEALLQWTAEQAPSDVAWVGHAPDVGRMTAALIGEGQGHIRLAKGGCAAIAIDGPPRLAGGELYWLATARLLGVKESQ